MARFFQAPIVQPMDYGFKLPFNEIMGALSIKQKEQDSLKAELGKLQDNPLDALAADYDLRGGSVTQSQRNVDAIMYDENGNVRDLTGQTRQIQAEARRQYMQKQTGGIDWGVSTSKTIHDKYLEEIAKNEKITADAKNYYIEASQHKYTEKGGLGAPQGAGGLYTEGQLFQGIKPAAYVDIPKLGEVYGDKVGQTQIQTSGATIDPTTSKVMSVDGKHFQSKDFGMIQTGTLLTTTYEQIFNSTAQGIAGNEEAVQYLEHEAKALAWKAGNKNPTEEQIDQHVNSRIKEEADRAGHKFMSAKFEPKVYDNWLYQYKVKQANDLALIKAQEAEKIPLIEVPLNSTQTNINPETFTVKKKDIAEALVTNDIAIKAMEINGKLKPELASNPTSAKQYQDLKDKQRDMNFEMKGIQNVERNVLAQGGFNSANIMLGTLDKVMNAYDTDPTIKHSLAMYLVTGKTNKALLTDEEQTTVNNVYKSLEHYTKDPKLAATIFTNDMQTRAEELASGNLPTVVVNEINKTKTYGKGAADTPAKYIIGELKTAYNKTRDALVLETTNYINKNGGANFQTQNTLVEAGGSETSSGLANIEKGGIEALKKTGFAGLRVVEGGLEGQVFDKKLLLTGFDGWVLDDSSLALSTIKENVGTPGLGGKAKFSISAKITNPQTKETKNTNLIVTVAPGKSSNLTEVRDRGSIELMQSIVMNPSEKSAQSDWATASALLGGNTPLIEAIYDQGISNMGKNDRKDIVDNEGRPLITVFRRENDNYEFFWPKKGANGEYQFSIDDRDRIADERANYYAKERKAQGDVDFQFKNLMDFQEQVGEKVFHSKTNRKHQTVNKSVFADRYLFNKNN